MGFYGPEFHCTADVMSYKKWLKDMDLYETNLADSVTWEAHLYDDHRKTITNMQLWRGVCANKWHELQAKSNRLGAFCGGQSL